MYRKSNEIDKKQTNTVNELYIHHADIRGSLCMPRGDTNLTFNDNQQIGWVKEKERHRHKYQDDLSKVHNRKKNRSDLRLTKKNRGGG